MSPFITALSGDLVSKTFLFIGFSFSDPNLLIPVYDWDKDEGYNNFADWIN